MAMVDGLLEQLKFRGLSIKHGGGDTLLLVGPNSEKTPEIMAALKTFKPDLLKLYRPEAEPSRCVTCDLVVYQPDEVGSRCEKANLCPYRKDNT